MLAVWQRLAAIERFVVRARGGARSGTGWRGRGAGRVLATVDPDCLRFDEHGRFQPAGRAGALTIDNRYCWQLDAAGIGLAHERRGRGAPVHLVTLVADRGARLVSTADHHCGRDRYAASLRPRGAGLRLVWRVVGPTKNETLIVDYA